MQKDITGQKFNRLTAIKFVERSIDHIRPDSSFDYKSVEDKEFQKCWALGNLRPLDAIKNIKKSSKIIIY